MLSFIVDPKHDPFAAKVDYKDARRMVGANYSSEASFLYKPFHHYDVVSRNYDRDLRCHYVLRLTNAAADSVG